ncbi:TetR family transcriptional regulator [Pseudonocardia sp. WMMC193]|uniref:TetR family transcriptional regulator n=1 Tax=Pseudonocardia sp. WMMC193 TaxID=2911965 RepID=UPI001F42298D|nr:TetR family transcriptional regulator [Pseudonocardia sp. WMMC193]MCF7550902.1 TetR family transcriptional regulator C-terminal domain-containing protein [Pseudonocardia sp. WMMC193]
MSRSVDHEARRADLAAAVWALVACGGVESVSLRSVAAEAGVSMGRVQYYFATKEDLLLHGLEQAHLCMEARIEKRVAATGGDAREILATILDELLGEHPRTRDAIRVHAAFAARAVDARTAAVLTDGDEEILALAVAVVAQAREAGRVGADVDPELDGYTIWTLARGLGTDVALYGAPIDRARATLARALARVAPPTG